MHQMHVVALFSNLYTYKGVLKYRTQYVLPLILRCLQRMIYVVEEVAFFVQAREKPTSSKLTIYFVCEIPKPIWLIMQSLYKDGIYFLHRICCVCLRFVMHIFGQEYRKDWNRYKDNEQAERVQTHAYNNNIILLTWNMLNSSNCYLKSSTTRFIRELERKLLCSRVRASTHVNSKK